MATLDGIYFQVVDEAVGRGVESSSHSVEEGYPITDNVKVQPHTISLSGFIVNIPNGYSASEILSRFENLQSKGALVRYAGRNVYDKMQIQSFNSRHSNKVAGGMEYDMELKQVRIAKNAYQAPKKSVAKNAGTQQISKGDNEAVYHTVKKGECIWNLVTKTYKSLKRGDNNDIMSQCKWVMSKNPSAFSRKNDFTTLQIGKKILIGYRK